MHRTLCAVGIIFMMTAGTLAIAASQPPHPPSQHGPHGVRRSNDPCALLPSRWQRAQCFNYHHSAPGDEYFGRMKMSYLGIDNTAHDVAIEAGAYTIDPGLIAKVMFADEALHQWEHRYPGDPQLARSYFLMIEVLRKIYTMPAQHLAWAYMQHLMHAYPNTYFAKLIRADVSLGFTEHWFAVAQVCPPPLPTPNPRARPTPTPTPTPTPEPTDTPTPTPPGQPKVDVITPPCVQATPTPPVKEEESPLPQEMPSESPSPTPTP